MNGQTENTISISQDGVANETDINQEGTNNTLEVVQTGNQNELLIDQQGNSNTIFQSQTGNSNIAEATQLETLFNGNIEQVQEGFNNEMSAKQDIDFTFVSVRNTIIQSQNGGFNSAIADQNRISRFLDVNGTENIIEQSQQGIFNADSRS